MEYHQPLPHKPPGDQIERKNHHKTTLSKQTKNHHH